jgi:hypothetical protein
VHCCTSHLVTRGCRAQEGVSRVDHNRALLSLTHAALRADPPSGQQVHSKVSLRRAVDDV